MSPDIRSPVTPTPNRPGKMSQSQSLNHLLNFSLPPRQSQPPPRRSRKYGAQHGVWNKERFVNAQYRFVMDPTGDFTVHFADPDIYFQWQDILQVIIPRTSALASASAGGESHGQHEGHTTCPICLSPPVAPRMTKCGHVFCFPCILHLINTSDGIKWVRCPICFDSVNEYQLKSVKWYEGPDQVEDEPDHHFEASSSSSSVLGSDFVTSHRPGSMMRLRLMQRPQITTLALPRSSTWPSDVLPPHQAPFHFLPDVYSFAKFMLATPSYLIEDFTRELDQLAAERRSLAVMGEELGVTFIDAADQKVRHQMAKAAALESPMLRDAVERAHREHQETEARVMRAQQRRSAEAAQAQQPEASPEEVPEAYLASRGRPFGGNQAQPAPVPAPSPGGRNPRQRRNLNPPPPSTSTYYYYQSASGLPIFLHPLDIKIMLARFESYASFPDNISVRVEASNEGTVNDDLRKRCKYLAHLPEGADVVFVEADLTGVVGAEGLRAFEGALRTRRTRRREKGRKDDKASKRAEERERERRTAEGVDAAQAVGGWGDFGHIVAPPLERLAIQVDEFPAADPAEPVTTATADASATTGAWGQRTFASALHSAPGQPRSRAAARQEEDWDVDGAWDELEQHIVSGGGGGRKKRGTRMVVLGGGGGRRR